MINATSSAVGAREDLVSLRRDEGPQQTRATFVERYVCIMDGEAGGDGRTVNREFRDEKLTQKWGRYYHKAVK